MVKAGGSFPAAGRALTGWSSESPAQLPLCLSRPEPRSSARSHGQDASASGPTSPLHLHRRLTPHLASPVFE